jgi:hypothetical protein
LTSRRRLPSELRAGHVESECKRAVIEPRSLGDTAETLAAGKGSDWEGKGRQQEEALKDGSLKRHLTPFAELECFGAAICRQSSTDCRQAAEAELAVVISNRPEAAGPSGEESCRPLFSITGTATFPTRELRSRARHN